MATAMASLLWSSGRIGPAPASRAQEAEPSLHSAAVVAVGDREVCSLLGAQKQLAGIIGQDSGSTAELNGTVYLSFGDTILRDGSILPNVLGYSQDKDASDCIDLQPKQEGGKVVPLLPRVEGSELTVWPIALEATGPNRIHAFYISVVADPRLGWRSAGVGLASFDTATLTATRSLDGALVWPAGVPQPTSTFVDGGYVYVILNAQRDGSTLETIFRNYAWSVDTLLARVPTGEIDSPASYEYWQPGDGAAPGQWLTGLWHADTRSWDPAINSLGALWRQVGGHNGVKMAYNEFLGKWTAVYSARFLSTVNMRVADSITGPWSTEAGLVDCSTFHPAPQTGFVCYSGHQHEMFERDGGRTIYISYANGTSYQVYLHEIHLGAKIVQWTDAEGHAVYLPSGANAPEGYTAGGTVFYASDIPVPGLAAIHRWRNLESGELRYGPAAPADGYEDLGVDFYAPADAAAAAAMHAAYAPVYRWTLEASTRFSPLNLGPLGYERQEVAFYGACPDSDSDGLLDCDESFAGTDPASTDSDGDGLSDRYELATPGCNATTPNADDGDGVSREKELYAGMNACIWDSGAWGCLNAPVHDPGCDIDTDGDGCMDAWELGPDARFGGKRDPNNPWDFYDVPDASGHRNGVVDLYSDVLGVAFRFGSRPAADASTLPTSRTYMPEFDRSQPSGTTQMRLLGPPDGSINIMDIFSVVGQFGHRCVAGDRPPPPVP